MFFDTLTPKYSLSVNGKLVSSIVNQRLISLNTVDNRGFEADTLTISLDDHDGLLEIPALGAKISVQIGFNYLVDKGDFIIDSVAHTGAPDVLTLSAKSADFREKLLEQKNKAYHDKTIQEIVEEIAGEHNLTPKVADEFADIKLQDRQQSNESDANFLTRLAEEYDAIATVKKGYLLFVKRGNSKTASGSELPIIYITRNQGDNHSYSKNDRDAYTGVKAKYVSDEFGERKEVLAGDEEKTKMLRKTYKNEDDALRAAENELKKLKRGTSSFSFNLAIGNPELISESPVKVQGFKEVIDVEEWIAMRVSNSLDQSGLTTTVEAEIKSEDESINE